MNKKQKDIIKDIIYDAYTLGYRKGTNAIRGAERDKELVKLQMRVDILQ